MEKKRIKKSGIGKLISFNLAIAECFFTNITTVWRKITNKRSNGKIYETD